MSNVKRPQHGVRFLVGTLFGSQPTRRHHPLQLHTSAQITHMTKATNFHRDSPTTIEATVDSGCFFQNYSAASCYRWKGESPFAAVHRELPPRWHKITPLVGTRPSTCAAVPLFAEKILGFSVDFFEIGNDITRPGSLP